MLQFILIEMCRYFCESVNAGYKGGIQMARPRKQTYTLDMYLKKNKKGDIDNNADVQRNFVWNNEQINELIVTVLTDDYIPPIILGEEENSKLHIVDGGCRTAALRRFREGNYKITSSVENSMIPYKKRVVDTDRCMTHEDAVCDIKGLTYEKLPEELKEKFDEYQIETVIHEYCDSHKISRYIKRYNNHVPMNADQKAFTYLDKFAGRIHQILESRFFLECTNYSENERIKGAVERIVVETIMCMNHFDKWNKQPRILCQYLNGHASAEEFDRLSDHLSRLEKIITDDLKELFDKKDSFIFLTLFDRFTKLGVEDDQFARFLKEFKEHLRGTARNADGFLFDEIKRNNSTKDKPIVAEKLAMLERFMQDYLRPECQNICAAEKKPVTAKELVKAYVDQNVDDKDMELYEMIANDISEVIEDIDSEFLSEQNRPSFVALVGYAVQKDIERLLKDWLPAFEKKNVLLSDQRKNYLKMKTAFERYAAHVSKKSA